MTPRRMPHNRLKSMAGVLTFAIALSLALPQAARAQKPYPVLSDLQYDEGFGMRVSNGSTSGAAGTGGVGTFTDGAAAWTVNAYAGGYVTVSSVAYPILSNTATVLTVTGTPPAGPTAYSIAGGWRGWNILGATDMPYDFVEDYPADTADNRVDRISLDLQDNQVLYPRVYASKGDTGRIVRMQILDGGNPLDISGYTITVLSKKQSDNSTVRNYDDISTYRTFQKDGWIEWLLNSTKDTAESIYFQLKLVSGANTFYLPMYGWLYIDVKDNANVAYTSGVVRPDIRIKAGGWDGKTIRFQFKDALRNLMDLSGVTVGINTAAGMSGPSFLAATSCDNNGVCSFGIVGGAGKFASANIYTIYFRLTSPSGEIIYVPSRGHIILEAY